MRVKSSTWVRPMPHHSSQSGQCSYCKGSDMCKWCSSTISNNCFVAMHMLCYAYTYGKSWFRLGKCSSRDEHWTGQQHHWTALPCAHVLMWPCMSYCRRNDDGSQTDAVHGRYLHHCTALDVRMSDMVMHVTLQRDHGGSQALLFIDG